MHFPGVHPDLSLDLFVPEDWKAGLLDKGPETILDQPRVVLFGGVADPSLRIIVELRYAVTSRDSAAALFANLAVSRHGAKLQKQSTSETLHSIFVEYSRAEGDKFVERIVTGKTISVSLFSSTTENQVLLDELQLVLTRSLIQIRQ